MTKKQKLRLGIILLIFIFIVLSAYQIYYVAHLSDTWDLDYDASVTFEQIKDRLDTEMDQLWLVDIAQVIFASLVVLALYIRVKILELEVDMYRSFETKEKKKEVKKEKKEEVVKLCRIKDVELHKEKLATLTSNCQGFVDYLSMATEAASAIIYKLEDGALVPYGSFATEKKYSFYSSYSVGVGIVGEVAKSKRPMIIKDVNSTELMVTSGLGSVIPLQLIALPLLFDGELVGVVELSYLDFLSEQEENYLGQLCEVKGVK